MNRKFTLIPRNGWRHFWVLAMLILLNVHRLYAQIPPASSYGFTAVSGTYTEITTGPTLALLSDDGTVSGIPLDFTFRFCGNDYTTLRACANGWFTFDPANANNQWTNDIANLGQIKPGLMALWDDLGGQGTGGTQSEARYNTTGTAPNRVFTIQYKNWQWNVGSTPSISFQVKLYETTNIIEYVYRQETAANSSTTATIGICDGAATPTYLTLNNSTTTAVASSTTFTTSIGVKPATGQIFRFTPPPPCNTITTWPAATAATIFPSAICGTGPVTLNITTAMPIATGLTYQWQSSPTGAAPWTDVGTAGNAPLTVIPNVSSTLYFRCRVLCNGNTTTPVWTSNASPQLVVNNPGSPAVTPGTRCGPGTVALSATPTANGPTLRWYTAPTGGMPVFTGANFTTNFITANTNFYVTAGTALVSGNQAVGAGALTSPTQDVTPFSAGWGGSKHQFLIRASELAALGLQPGSIITSLSLDVVAGGVLYPGLAISMKNTTTNVLTATYEGGVSEVRGATDHTTTVGLNTFAFTTANFTWDGSSNILIQTCWSNQTTNSVGSTVKCDNVGFNATFRGQTDSQTPAAMCGVTGPSSSALSTQRPQFTFAYQSSCQGPRVPVLATVTPSPAVTKTFPPIACSNEITNITVNSSPITNYTNYGWTPLTDLYTNATATTPYAGGSATTVYMKATDAGPRSYFLYATNVLPAACAFADTVRIWVQPDSVTIAGTPDTICNSGTTTLSLVPNTGYAPNSIQWQESTDGTNYSNITGATGVNFTTPTLTANRWYKALIRSTNATCQNPVKLVIVAHPSLVSAPDSFHCGPGPVVLTANTGGFSSAVWYTTATGGLPVGSGSPWTTPTLGTTTNYYVAAGGGTAFGNSTVGAGANTSATQSSTPFSSGWGGSKHQYLIRAADLIAAGIPSGATLNSIALDVVAGGVLYPGLAISMKLTSTTALTATYEGGTVEVKAPANHTTTVGINTFALTTPFTWDGTSNLLIQTCWSNQTTNSVGSTVRIDNTTYVSSFRGQNDSQTPAAMCGVTGPSSSATYSQRPKFIFGYSSKCETAREEVKAYIRPVPVVDLGQDIDKCVDAGDVEVLDAGVQPNGPQFLWDNGSAMQVRAITQSGTYSVRVTNEYTCTSADTIVVLFRRNPVVKLGNDTTVCNGVVLPLNAGADGIDYFWSTGQTTQMINVTAAGSYNVFVTNSVGCVKTDTIVVNMAGELPTVQGINVTNNGINTFQFSAVNPQNVIGYEWDFGDSTAHAYSSNPIHTYANPGNYIVTLHLSSSCGFLTDSTSAHIVGIHQLNIGNDELTVYPNPAKETATILNKGALKMESVSVYNILGQVVYKATADSNDKHTMQLNGFSSGVYTIQIFTDKGTVARKLEIVR